ARWPQGGRTPLKRAGPPDAKRRHAIAQVNLPEAPHAQVLREIVGRPGRDPHLATQSVHRLDGGHEIVVARDQHGRIEGTDGGVVNHFGDEPRVDALLGRVLVVDAARGAAPGTAHPELPLDEVARAELETFQEAFDQGRGVGRYADVVMSAREDGAGAPDGLRDPGGEAVVVYSERFV